jgi:hypothetical protein
LEDQKNGRRRKIPTIRTRKEPKESIKVIEEERTAGTLKLTAIALRRMRARAGDLKLTVEGALVG